MVVDHQDAINAGLRLDVVPGAGALAVRSDDVATATAPIVPVRKLEKIRLQMNRNYRVCV